MSTHMTTMLEQGQKTLRPVRKGMLTAETRVV